MPIKDFYNATDVQPGDIFVCIVKVMVGTFGEYTVYRCKWPADYIGDDGTPQGGSMGDETLKIENLFPIIATKKHYEQQKKEWETFLVTEAFPILDDCDPDYEDEDHYMRSLLYANLPNKNLSDHEAQAVVNQWRKARE